VHQRDTLSLSDYMRVLKRRKLTIAVVTVVSVLAAFAYTKHQTVLYQSQAGVLLSRQSLVTALTGVVDPSSNQQPDRVAQTQADVARSPAVAKAVLEALRPNHPELAQWTPSRVLASTTAAPQSGADLLIFQATSHNAGLARDLVNQYALQYTKYRELLDNDAVTAAIDRIQTALETTTSKSLAARLQQKKQDLLTIASLQSGNTRVVTPAEGASQTQPKTTRTVLLGCGLGLILGIMFAFAREALDTRVRTGSEVSAALDLPVLARLPSPPRALRKRDQLVMLADPAGPAAEAFRILRTNFDFANLRIGAQAIMITSALEREGKSTTLANLALAFAQAGRRVCIIDLDLRRPYMDRFFSESREPGFTNLALGRITLDEVLNEVDLTGVPSTSRSDMFDTGRGGTGGSLHCITGGLIPPDPADILDSDILEKVLSPSYGSKMRSARRWRSSGVCCRCRPHHGSASSRPGCQPPRATATDPDGTERTPPLRRSAPTDRNTPPSQWSPPRAGNEGLPRMFGRRPPAPTPPTRTLVVAARSVLGHLPDGRQRVAAQRRACLLGAPPDDAKRRQRRAEPVPCLPRAARGAPVDSGLRRRRRRVPVLRGGEDPGHQDGVRRGVRQT
jgi:capsular polysaccharide biosynthesis protein